MNPHTNRHIQRALRAACLCVAAWSLPVWSQAPAPASQPLMNRNGGGVKPNVMLTIDVSGSMSAQHMPEGEVRVGPYSVMSPAGGHFSRMHPDDGGSNGAVPAVPGGLAYWTQQFMRSPDTNALYYNPTLRYLPWIRATGSRYPNANPTAAQLDPNAATPTVDLTRVIDRNTDWCIYMLGSVCRRMPLQYSAALYYRLKKTGGVYADPRVAGNYDEVHINASGNPTFTKYPARTDCAGTSCTQDEERKNFANWFVYHRSRLLLAKAALGEALQGMQDAFRLGYGRTDLGPKDVDGIKNLSIVESGVRDFNADRKAAVLSWLYGLQPSGTTPLRTAINEVGRYYSSPLASGSWSDTPGSAKATPHQACRRSYHVLMTDGYWNDAAFAGGVLPPVGNVDGTTGPVIRDDIAKGNWQYRPAAPYADNRPDMLADYAMRYWARDLRDDLPNTVPSSRSNPATWQSLTHFTVGLGVRGKLDPLSDLPALTTGKKSWGSDQIDDLWHAAINSRGGYFSAQTAEQLRVALESALRSAVERELPEAGVTTASPAAGSANRTYVPRYRSGVWTGDVEAYPLDAGGQVKGEALWSAKENLPDWTQRRLFTWEPATQGVPFRWDTLGKASRDALNPDWRSAALVDFIRGDRSGEEVPNSWRVRESLLGDFINSAPVFVKDASDAGHAKLPGAGSSYAAYLTAKAVRPGVLYVGGNDGMLHAFRDSLGATGAGGPDGAEMFAYVPRAVLPKLHILAQRNYGSTSNFHQYYVDGPLIEADVHVKAPDTGITGWRNYLFGTTGVGARAVFALDVTDPEGFGASGVRWEVNAESQPELGHVLAPVASGRLPNGQWVALFGNGYGGASGKATLFVVDVETGAVTTITPASDQSDNGLGGIAVRKDDQGQIVALYAGDLAGSLWRFDYDATAAGGFTVGNGGKPVFRNNLSPAPLRQAIVQAPLVFDKKEGGFVVVFASGRLITEADADNQAVQAVYGVWDRPVKAFKGTSGNQVPPEPVILQPGDLEPRKLTAVNGTGARTQQVYVKVDGEKIDWSRKPGWTISLGGLAGYEGLRVLLPLQVALGRVVLVSAVAPGAAVTGCDTSLGRGINLLVPIDSGSAPSLPYFDTDGNGSFTSTDARVSGYATSSDGRDAVVQGSKPVKGDKPSDDKKNDPGTTPGTTPGNGPGEGGGGGGGANQDPDPRPPCPPGLIYLVSSDTSVKVCVRDKANIVGRIWRRVPVPRF